jgi:hypothetical protein
MAAGHPGKYEALVAAESATEAVEIAAEALPRGVSLIESKAEAEGHKTWRVTLKFRGGKRASSDLVE